MSDTERAPRPSPLPRQLMKAGRLPLLYALLEQQRPEDGRLYRMALSRPYRARGFEVGGAGKPLTRCFTFDDPANHE